MRRKVFCSGCAYLFMLWGSKQTEATPPMCVASARFVAGPLRKKIEVLDVKSAMRRNLHNDCDCRISVSLRAWEIKRWLLWRLNNGGKGIGEASVKRYPIDEELRFKKEDQEGKYGKSLTHEEATELFSSLVDEKVTDLICSAVEEETTESGRSEETTAEETTGEIVLTDGGIDGDNERGSENDIEGEDVQDS